VAREITSTLVSSLASVRSIKLINLSLCGALSNPNTHFTNQLTIKLTLLHSATVGGGLLIPIWSGGACHAARFSSLWSMLYWTACQGSLIKTSELCRFHHHSYRNQLLGETVENEKRLIPLAHESSIPAKKLPVAASNNRKISKLR